MHKAVFIYLLIFLYEDTEENVQHLNQQLSKQL